MCSYGCSDHVCDSNGNWQLARVLWILDIIESMIEKFRGSREYWKLNWRSSADFGSLSRNASEVLRLKGRSLDQRCETDVFDDLVSHSFKVCLIIEIKDARRREGAPDFRYFNALKTSANSGGTLEIFKTFESSEPFQTLKAFGIFKSPKTFETIKTSLFFKAPGFPRQQVESSEVSSAFQLL